MLNNSLCYKEVNNGTETGKFSLFVITHDYFDFRSVLCHFATLLSNVCVSSYLLLHITTKIPMFIRDTSPAF